MKISETFIRKIPKSELHVHLDGSLRISTLIELAKLKKIQLPSYSESGMKELVFKNQYRDLKEYLKGFMYTTAVLQDEESLERTAYELAEDCADEGIRYLEVRLAPQLHVSTFLTLERVLQSVNNGLDRFRKYFNTKSSIVEGEEPEFNYGIICCAMRMFTPAFSEYYKKFYEIHEYSPDTVVRGLASKELALAIVRIRDEKGLPIVGFDLAGEEAGYPAGHHAEAFQVAHRHFLKKTVHAGEAFGPESIFQAITDLHADRIGHGYHLFSENLITDPQIKDKTSYIEQLSQYIADRRITIEVCLTSNSQTMPNLTDWHSHSLNRFLEQDLSISLCTDNRTVSNTTLSKEIALAVRHFNISEKKLKNIIIYGFKRSFYPGSYTNKRKYVRKVIDYYELLEEQEKHVEK